MKPVLWTFGPLHLYSFGLMVAIGVLIALQLMLRRGRLDGKPSPEDVYDYLWVTLVSGFIGARFFYVLQSISWYLRHPAEIFAVWEGGLIFYGGVIAAFASLYVFSKIRKISIFRILDFMIPYGVLAHAFGRIGCFLNGCCYGHATQVPWAVVFPEVGVPVHPTQLYEAVYNFIVFIILNFWYPRRRFDGQVTALYFIFYGVGRFAIEFWRADNPVWMFLTVNQWISIGSMVLGILIMVRKQNAGKIA